MKNPLAIAAVAAALTFAALGGTANAAQSVPSTDHISFGSQAVGTTSAPQAVSLDVPCYFVLDGTGWGGGLSCTAPGRVDTVELVGDDFSMTHDCPLPISNSSTDGSILSCTITVRFNPLAQGPRTGAINIGTPGVPDAWTVALAGTGVQAPAGGTPGSGTGSDTDGAAGHVPGSAAPMAKAKKCKRGKGKARKRAKKCKKQSRRLT